MKKAPDSSVVDGMSPFTSTVSMQYWSRVRVSREVANRAPPTLSRMIFCSHAQQTRPVSQCLPRAAGAHDAQAAQHHVVMSMTYLLAEQLNKRIRG